jgi:hypothetical protein
MVRQVVAAVVVSSVTLLAVVLQVAVATLVAVEVETTLPIATAVLAPEADPMALRSIRRLPEAMEVLMNPPVVVLDIPLALAAPDAVQGQTVRRMERVVAQVAFLIILTAQALDTAAMAHQPASMQTTVEKFMAIAHWFPWQVVPVVQAVIHETARSPILPAVDAVVAVAAVWHL